MARFLKPPARSPRISAALPARAMAKPAGPGPLGELRERLGNRNFGVFLQTKLTVGRADDAFEMEADRVAEEIVGMPDRPAASPGIQADGGPAMPVRRQVAEDAGNAGEEGEADEYEEEEAEVDISDAGGPGIQLACAGCDDEDESGDQDDLNVQMRRDSSAAPLSAPAGAARGVESLRGGGNPLPPSLRAYFEPRFGRDFSAVRTHTDPVADETSRALGARAYTFGTDIAFRAGAFAPSSEEGRTLLAHELTHVVQQTGGFAPTSIQRKNGKPAAKRKRSFKFAVHIGSALTTDQLLLEFVKQYHGVTSDVAAEALRDQRQWKWTGTPKAPTAAEIKQGYKLLTVTDTSSSGAASRGDEPEYMKRLPQAERDKMNAEIDRRFWEKTKYKTGEKLGSSADDQAMAEYWRDVRDDLVQMRQAIEELPPAVKDFLFTKDAPVLEPKDYEKVLHIARTLERFSPAELADYKTKVNAETRDWNEFDKSLKRYLIERDVRKHELQEREQIKTKLFGLDELYTKYRQLKSLEFKETLAAVGAVVSPGTSAAAGVIAAHTRAELEAELNRELPRHKFANIDEFEKYIEAYELAFQKETVNVAFDLLAQYEHILYVEEKRYQDPANIAPLYQSIAQSKARAQYAEAASYRSLAASITPDPELHRFMPGEWELKQRYTRQAEAAKAAAQGEFAGATAGHPLLKNRDFPREGLTRAAQDDVQSMLLGYIRDRREDIGRTRAHLTEKPSLVFELDDLLKASFQVQGIAPESIYGRIVRDKIRDKTISDTILKVVLAVIAIALTIVSFGTGTVAVLAAIGAFGISAYQAIQEFREYEIKSSAYGAQLLSDDPSFAWVIVAAVGAGFDLAGIASALRLMKPAVDTFNATGDILKLEKELKTLAEVSEQLRNNTLKAARAELQYKQAVQGLLASTGRLNGILIPVEEFGRLVGIAYYLAKRGVIAFEKFVLELKAQKIISEWADLSPEAQALLKQAFEEGVKKSGTGLLKYGELSQQIRNVYTVEQVEDIAQHGKLLGYSDKEITDFLEMGSIAKPMKKPPKVPLTPDEIKSQMENWLKVVKPRGFPYLFENLEQFESFKSALKDIVKKYGVSNDKIVLQGSSLRTPAAKDVDIAIFVSDDLFAKYAQKCRDGLLSRVGDKAKGNLLQQLDDQISDGYISKFFFDRIDPKISFGAEVHTILEAPFKVITDISVMKESSRLALTPAMKL
jgi:hypothetical protein